MEPASALGQGERFNSACRQTDDRGRLLMCWPRQMHNMTATQIREKFGEDLVRLQKVHYLLPFP